MSSFFTHSKVKNLAVPTISSIAMGVVVLSGCSGVESGLTPEPVSSQTQSATPSPEQPQVVPTETATPEGNPPVGTNEALLAVDSLTVKGRAPKTGYDRDQFGPSWKDVDKNGCDTRNDILRRDLSAVTYKDGSTCVIATGVLEVDPYTGVRIDWERGQTTSSAVQIDHVVALSDAWQKGAQGWDEATREQFANDPLNLIAADGPANQSKGDGDTATWLPPNTAYRCDYVARQVAVKKKYGVWVTEAEQQAMRDILTNCPSSPLPADSSVEVLTPPRVGS